MSQHHGASELRGLSGVPASPFFVGRFGRMFRTLPPFSPSDELIDQLAAEMKEPPAAPPSPGGADPGTPFDNPDIPAGFTYLGQFLDHDITFDPVSSLQHSNDPTRCGTSARLASTLTPSTARLPTISPSSSRTPIPPSY